LSVDKREKGWLRTLGDPTIDVLAVEVKNRIVAFSNFGPLRDKDLDGDCVGEIYAIYALEEFWNRGIGRKLMDTSITTLREMEYSAVKIWVIETNQRAISFYRKFGFTPDGAKKVGHREDFELNEVGYSLSLI